MATDTQGPEGGEADSPAWIPDEDFLPPKPAPVSVVRWRLGLVLLGLSLLGTAAVLPYSIALLRQAKDSRITPAVVPFIAIFSLAVEGAISAAAIGIGIGLGPRTGLGPSLLEGFDGPTGEAPDVPTAGSSFARGARAVGLAAAIGVGLGLAVVGYSYASRSAMPESATKIVSPSPLEGLVASFGAGIREEVWLRLGFMTLLAWAAMAIARRRPGDPASIWGANVLAALAFGAMHLPQAAMLIGLNAAVVGFVFLGNGIPGVAFGWLFWRKGLVAAMVAHFMMDVVLKAILPAVTG